MKFVNLDYLNDYVILGSLDVVIVTGTISWDLSQMPNLEYVVTYGTSITSETHHDIQTVEIS